MPAINKNIVLVYKPAGLTPLETLNLLRQKYPFYSQSVLSYAGRLDPQAEGVMLVLVDEENKQRQQYLSLDKEYSCQILFGLSTDTGDVMGLVKEIDPRTVSLDEVRQKSEELVGRHQQIAPTYSAPGIDGKNFTKEIEIYALKVRTEKRFSSQEVMAEITKKINQVPGNNFRQKEILKRWEEILQPEKFIWQVFTITVTCSSGTYLRVLANDLGMKLGQPALVYSLKRARVGDWIEKDCLIL